MSPLNVEFTYLSLEDTIVLKNIIAYYVTAEDGDYAQLTTSDDFIILDLPTWGELPATSKTVFLEVRMPFKGTDYDVLGPWTWRTTQGEINIWMSGYYLTGS